MNWTNYFRFLFWVIILTCVENAQAQIQLAFQGGEPGDNWTYTASAVSADGIAESTQAPNFVSGSQSIVVGGVSGGGSCISGGAGNGASIFHTFSFSDFNISTSSQFTRSLLFHYGNRLPACSGTGWDTGENLLFIPIHDGVLQDTITVFTGATNISVDINQNQFLYQVPPCVGTFGFVLGIKTNRNDEFLFVDNVVLSTPELNGPIPSFSTINGPVQACTGTTSILSTDEFGGVNYHWFDEPSTSLFITPNDTTVADSITLDWGTTLPGTYTISVSPTDACGLLSGDTISITVELIDNPQPLTITGPDTICEGSSATLNSSYLSGNVWSTQDSSQSIQVTQSGTYSVSVLGACGVLQSSINLTVLPLPNVSIQVLGNLALCPGQTVQLISNTVSDFTWSDQSINDTLTTGDAGLYILTVSNSCGSSSDSVEVLTIPGIIQPTIISAGSVICSGSNLILVSSESTGNSWSTGSNSDSIIVTLPGTYILSVDNGCASGNDTLVVSNSSLNFQSVADPDSGNAPLDVNFLVNSTNVISSYNWDFGGLGSSSSSTPSFVFNEAGLYAVIVEITDDAGCSGLDTIEVLVLPELPSELNVPNCFSPNGDGMNDFLTVDAISIKSFDLQVLNRWGVEMYQSSELLPGWDGKHNGENALDGTYFFVLKAEGSDSKSYELKGTITLIR
jgi:gliding motility-associated-like protein